MHPVGSARGASQGLLYWGLLYSREQQVQMGMRRGPRSGRGNGLPFLTALLKALASCTLPLVQSKSFWSQAPQWIDFSHFTEKKLRFPENETH